MSDGAALGLGAAIFGCAGLTLGADEAVFFREADPFGFILFARNIDTPDQVCRLTAALREAVGRDAPVLVDQEGGRVQRLRAPHWREWAPPLTTLFTARHEADAADTLRQQARVIAMELRAVGIDANCAPVADIAGAATHPFLRNRCHGTDPQTVADVAFAVAEGLASKGVIPIMKHIPGHGRSTLDTHLALPVVEEDAETLRAWDFAPFRALRHLPVAMTAHVIYRAFDALRPATQSPRMVQVIREEIGFAGLLISDDLGMEALSGTPGARAAATLAAGVDIALHCNGDLAEMEAVAEATGAMGADTRARAREALAWRVSGGQRIFDAWKARERSLALENGAPHGG